MRSFTPAQWIDLCQLLLKILEVHPELNLDVNAVAGAWRKYSTSLYYMFTYIL